jgi:hypothetical protein
MKNFQSKRDSAAHRARRGSIGPVVTPVGQVASFFDFFTPRNPNYGQDANLINLFSVDSANPNPPPAILFPVLGITDHAVPGKTIGPGVHGRTRIQRIFHRLFASFEGTLLFDPLDASPYLQSIDGSTVSVRITITGTQTGTWFPPGDADASLPFSALPSAGKPSTIAACAVFTFDGTPLIQQLALYMDRYKLMSDLQPEDLTTKFNPKITTFLQNL